jgi:hypothetical protein
VHGELIKVLKPLWARAYLGAIISRRGPNAALPEFGIATQN